MTVFQNDQIMTEWEKNGTYFQRKDLLKLRSGPEMEEYI